MGRYRMRPARCIPALIVVTCLAGLLLWTLWISAAWAKSAVMQRRLDIRFMATDEINETATVAGLVFRSEEPLQAPAAGELILKARDGERVRSGALLAEIKGVQQTEVRSPNAGVFCTHVDGLEGLLQPAQIDALDLTAVEKIKDSAPPSANAASVAHSDNKVDSGQVFGKLVDNLQPVFVYIRWQNTDAEAAGKFRAGGNAYLIYKGQELAAQIKDALTIGGETDLLLQLSEYPDDFIHQRDLELQLVCRRLAGWLVPKEAVIFKDGRPGIYVILKEQVSWLPVAVTDRMGNTVSITGSGLNDTLRYICNPDRVDEGTRLTTGG